LTTELRIEDVEAGLGLDVGQVELVTKRAANRAGKDTAEHENGDPQAEDETPTVVTPGT
jgi:hypothetical protein